MQPYCQILTSYNYLQEIIWAIWQNTKDFSVSRRLCKGSSISTFPLSRDISDTIAALLIFSLHTRYPVDSLISLCRSTASYRPP